MLSSFRQIKTLLVSVVMTVAVFSSHAAESPVTLPPIEAKAYDLKVVRPSASGRVYLFEKPDAEMPDIGRIVLLREAERAVMAFRVLKVYPEKSQVAAKKVREYSGTPTLLPNSNYRAYEKVGDILTVPDQTKEDVSDLKDLEGASAPLPEGPSGDPEPSNDPAIPAIEAPVTESTPESSPAPSPQPSGTAENSEGNGGVGSESDAIEPGNEETFEVDETSFRDEGSKDYFPNWLSLEVGGIRNIGIPSGRYQRGIGLAYGRNLWNNIFSKSADYPDMLTLDAGFHYYKTNVVEDSAQKSYTLLPLKALMRYTKPVSETVSLYLYGGLFYNNVIGQLNVSQEELDRIAVMSIAAGVGGLIQFGPNWYIKLNLGLDTVGLGIVLRY